MILQLFGLVAIFVFTYFVFRTAKYGRQAVLLAVLTFGIGIGTQIFVPILIATVLSICLILTGTQTNKVVDMIEGWSFGIMLGCFGISLVSMFLILKRVSRIPDEVGSEAIDLPPPPTFGT